MDLTELLTTVQHHYTAQLVVFIAEQKAHGQGAGEVNFQLSAGSQLFRDLYCADFAFGPKAPGGPKIVDMWPDKALSFPPSTYKHGSVSIRIESLRWDNVKIMYSGRKPDLGPWFETWFDPDDKRHDPKAALGGKIHSLSIGDGVVNVDFGSAPPKAFIEMTEAFASAGVRQLTVSVGD